MPASAPLNRGRSIGVKRGYLRWPRRADLHSHRLDLGVELWRCDLTIDQHAGITLCKWHSGDPVTHQVELVSNAGDDCIRSWRSQR